MKQFKRVSLFCEKLLRFLENNKSFEKELSKDFKIVSEKVAYTFIQYSVSSLKLGSNEPSLILKMIDVVQKLPQIVGKFFMEISEDLPCWIFIKVILIIKNEKYYMIKKNQEMLNNKQLK